MIDYGVAGYTIRVARTRGAWAHCDFTNKELVFNPSLLWTDWVFVNQIILHEVAHAIAGRWSGHGRKWEQTARAMGYRLGAIVPYRERVPGVHRWVSTCATGQHSAMRYKEHSDPEVQLLCRPCYDSGAGEVDVRWERL
jgi:SprT protein